MSDNPPPTVGAASPLENRPPHCIPKSTDSIAIDNHDAVIRVLERSILNLWEVVNELAAIQPAKPDRYRVTIFGSARMKPDSAIYNDVRALAAALTTMGCDIVTGGGPGLMEAANAGSVMGDPDNQHQSIGIRVDLPFEQSANAFVEEAYNHKTFFSRLHHFVMLSDAFIIMPGGIGTTLEATMIWQLLQVQQLQHVPLIMVGEMWSEFVDWADRFMVQTDMPLAAAADLQIPHCVDRVETAIEIIRKSQQEWLNCRD
jgi:uncharacterized protein (TIGR00730 family)